MQNNRIYYRLWNPAGLFNQVLSLETAVGVQHKSNANVILYNTATNANNFAIHSPNGYDTKYSKMISKQQKITIDDIFSWNSREHFTIKNEITKDCYAHAEKYNLSKFFLIDRDKEINNIKEFSSNRSPFYLSNNDMRFTNTLVSYSYFFYHRDTELDKSIESVSAKEEYVALAKKIAESLGDFDGIHLRLTDFPIFIYKVKDEMFNDAINSLNSGRKLVISTDDPDHYMLKNLNRSVIFLDNYIYENFYDDFKSLPFTDNIIFGLINNLVMHYSKDFIGTMGSTYTSYIQKNRVNKGLSPSWKFFNDLNYQKTGKYSWNNYPIEDGAKGWWREWEECLLIKE